MATWVDLRSSAGETHVTSEKAMFDRGEDSEVYNSSVTFSEFLSL
jgi:hypothetical protein